MPSSLLKNGSLLTRACTHKFHPEVLVLYTTQLPLNHKRKIWKVLFFSSAPSTKILTKYVQVRLKVGLSLRTTL